MSRRQHGFTLIELMIAIAVVMILIAVAIYAFSKPICHARSGEVKAMFAELKAKQDAYAVETGHYLCTSATCDETDLWPTPLPGKGQLMPATPTPPSWQTLRVNPAKAALYCQYGVVAGLAGSAPTGAKGQLLYPGPVPGNWYYLIAQCDWDGDPAPTANAWYWQRGDSTETGHDNVCR